MSKSHNNTIALRESPDEVNTKIRKMPTDPARIRRNDPGNPLKLSGVGNCIRSTPIRKNKIGCKAGCTSAGIGCLDCKKPLIEAIQAELKPIRIEALELENNQDVVNSIITEGCEKARDEAQDTLKEVRDAMGLSAR